MTAYVAMLRGINVGGHAKLSMANLRAAFAAMGHDDVQTYIQSGNVLFRARAPAAQTQAAIEMGLERRFGLVTTVVLRTGAQLAAVVAHNPLTAGARNPAKLHVTFLATKPAPSRVAAVDSGAFLPDELPRGGSRGLPALPRRLRPDQAPQRLLRAFPAGRGDDAARGTRSPPWRA